MRLYQQLHVYAIPVLNSHLYKNTTTAAIVALTTGLESPSSSSRPLLVLHAKQSAGFYTQLLPLWPSAGTGWRGRCQRAWSFSPPRSAAALLPAEVSVATAIASASVSNDPKSFVLVRTTQTPCIRKTETLIEPPQSPSITVPPPTGGRGGAKRKFAERSVKVFRQRP